ncbi:TPA: DNA gyrase subunit B, partial [Klebsiella pneumoniae]|nr:DNA gyrase subunit B [Klebsiella pneumoniae]
YAYEPHFHIKGYDSLKLDETVDVRSQIEGHFAYTYQ